MVWGFIRWRQELMFSLQGKWRGETPTTSTFHPRRKWIVVKLVFVRHLLVTSQTSCWRSGCAAAGFVLFFLVVFCVFQCFSPRDWVDKGLYSAVYHRRSLRINRDWKLGSAFCGVWWVKSQQNKFMFDWNAKWFYIRLKCPVSIAWNWTKWPIKAPKPPAEWVICLKAVRFSVTAVQTDRLNSCSESTSVQDFIKSSREYSFSTLAAHLRQIQLLPDFTNTQLHSVHIF